MPPNTLRRRNGAVNGASGRDAEIRVFDAILEAILDHRLAPGTKLIERDLTEILGASRAAVRGALARLEHSVLVELRPNRGAVVANPSVAETRAVLDARRVIESAIVESIATSLTPAKRTRLRTFVTTEQAAYDRGDLKTAQRLSIEFHKVLAEIAGNSVLDRFMDQLVHQTPLLVLAHKGTKLAFCGASDHRAVVEALLRGDAALAKKRMTEHLKHLQDQLKLDEPPAALSLASALRATAPRVAKGRARR